MDWLDGLTPALSWSGGTRVFFQQPYLAGIGGAFCTPTASREPPPLDRFGLTLWQPNPYQSGGGLVPVEWAMGDLTGFYPAMPGTAQLGFVAEAGSSGAQAAGPVVGAYIDSRDLIHGSSNSKMMIAPGFKLGERAGPFAFADAESAVHVLLYLQVPVAATAGVAKSYAYVSLDLGLQDEASGVEISFGTALFSAATSFHSTMAIDPPTGNMMINGGLFEENPYLEPAEGTTLHQNGTWRGLRMFAYTIPAARFAAALAELRRQHPDFPAATDPAAYRLRGVHLNAELQFAGGPARLGWSMQGLTVSLS